jgi:anhydro-N-acetylmuramic acid kinase
VVDFKEALIFAYLGLLRVLEKPNCQSQYTGSIRDHCAGSLHLG